MSGIPRKVLPKSKSKDPRARFREYFAAWIQDYPQITEIPPAAMATLIRLAVRNRDELEDLIKFGRRYKEAAGAATAEDVEAAYKMMHVATVMES